MLTSENQLSRGYTLLFKAIEKGDREQVVALLKQSPRLVNAREPKKGHTPLIRACLKGMLDMVRLLVEFKANINLACVETGMTPLMAALCSKASSASDVALWLLDLDTLKVDACDKVGRTSLFYAAQKDNTVVALKLIGLGANPNRQAQGALGLTPYLVSHGVVSEVLSPLAKPVKLHKKSSDNLCFEIKMSG